MRIFPKAPRATIAMLQVTILTLATSCFLMPEKKKGRNDERFAGPLVRDSVYFDRIGDGRAARLRFETKIPTHCEIQYYSQEEDVEPTKEHPKIHKCSDSGNARTKFIERITDLRTDTIYILVLILWKEGSSKDKSYKIRIPEPTRTDSDGDPKWDGSFKDLFVARMNIPLRVAEIYRHEFEQPQKITDVRGKTKRALGCRQGVPANQPPFRSASPELRFGNLITRDFAQGIARPHPVSENRLQMIFGTLNEGLDKWTILYDLEGQDRLVTVRPVTSFLGIEMTSGTSRKPFEDANLEEASEPLGLAEGEDLVLGWTVSSSLLSESYVTIQIGRPEYPRAIYCVFPANKRTGKVPSTLLADLSANRHVILAEVVSNLIYAKEGWLIFTHDWRVGRIQR